jgi:hypothetical protein
MARSEMIICEALEFAKPSNLEALEICKAFAAFVPQLGERFRLI